MTNTPDRDALSHLVVYPQNAHFVKTGEGEIYPYNIIQDQIRERASERLKSIDSEIQGTIFLGIVIPGVFVIMLLESLLRNSDTRAPIFSGAPYACLSCCLVIVVLTMGALFRTYQVKRDPERTYLNQLKKGRLIRGHVKQVTALSNGIVELTHTFELPWPTRQDRKAVRRYTAVTRIEPSKIFEEGDEVLVLYYDDDLMTIL
jgi:hypothetical protein